jgi:hypothetical protein
MRPFGDHLLGEELERCCGRRGEFVKDKAAKEKPIWFARAQPGRSKDPQRQFARQTIRRESDAILADD